MKLKYGRIYLGLAVMAGFYLISEILRLSISSNWNYFLIINVLRTVAFILGGIALGIVISGKKFKLQLNMEKGLLLLVLLAYMMVGSAFLPDMLINEFSTSAISVLFGFILFD